MQAQTFYYFARNFGMHPAFQPAPAANADGAAPGIPEIDRSEPSVFEVSNLQLSNKSRRL